MSAQRRSAQRRIIEEPVPAPRQRGRARPVELAVTIEAQRQQLFKALAVIEVCRYACASMFEGFDPEQLYDALKVVHELVDDVADVLEEFAAEEGTRQGGAA